MTAGLWARRLLLGVGGVGAASLALLAGLELSLRWHPAALHAQPPGLVRSHMTRGYELVPGFVGRTNVYAVEISPQGFRGRPLAIPKPAGTLRVACLGDSFTFGLGIPEAATYTQQLEQRLQQAMPGRPVEVLNGGVPGYDTVLEWRLLQEVVQRYEPDIILIQFAINDAEERPVYALPVKSAWLNRGKDLLRWLYSYNFLAERYYTLAARLNGLGHTDPQRRVAFYQAIYAEGHPGWRACREALASLQQFEEQTGTAIVLMLYPWLERLGPGGEYPYRQMHQTVRQAWQREDRLIDLLDVLHGQEERTLWASPQDHHPNGRCNALVAERIAGFLAEQPLLTGD